MHTVSAEPTTAWSLSRRHLEISGDNPPSIGGSHPARARTVSRARLRICGLEGVIVTTDSGREKDGARFVGQ
jgi:hypothetical protein